MTTSVGASTFAPGVRRALPVLLAQRLVLNTGGRMVFTFLPILAAGTGLSIAAMGRIIFARDMSGLLGPWIGRLVQRRGAWSMMTATGILASVGMTLTLLGPYGVAIGLALWGLCRTSFLVASNSWVGDVVAYERRGRASGMVELTWAAAALVGLPALGLLIEAFGWRAAPIAMAVLGAPIALWSKLVTVPEGGSGTGASTEARKPLRPATMVALGATSLLMASAQFLFFTHGLWLADTYGFDAAQIGFAVVAIGSAEALGSIGTLTLTDLIGKRRSVLLGYAVLGLAMAGFVVIPTPPLAAGIGLLVVAFLGSEFGIVSSIPLVSELEVDNRSAVIGLGTGMSTVARATVSLLAGWAYVVGGFRLPMILGAAMAFAGLVVMLVAVSEPAAEVQSTS